MRQQSYREYAIQQDPQDWRGTYNDFEQRWARIREKYGVEPHFFSPEQAEFIATNPEIVDTLIEVGTEKDIILSKKYNVADYLRWVTRLYITCDSQLHEGLTDLICSTYRLARSKNRLKDFLEGFLPQDETRSFQEQKERLTTLTGIVRERGKYHGRLDRNEFRIFISETLPLFDTCIGKLPAESLVTTARDYFVEKNGRRAIRDVHALLRSRLRGYNFRVDPGIRDRFHRAGLGGAEYLALLERTVGAENNPLNIFDLENLHRVMDLAIDAGVRGSQFEQYVAEIIPTYRALKSEGIEEHQLVSLLELGARSGFHGWQSGDLQGEDRQDFLANHPLDGSDLLPGFLDYATTAVPTLARTMLLAGSSRSLKSIGRFIEYQAERRRGSTLDPLSDKVTLWNYLVHILPSFSQQFKYAYRAEKQLWLKRENDHLLEMCDYLSLDDCGRALALYSKRGRPSIYKNETRYDLFLDAETGLFSQLDKRSANLLFQSLFEPEKSQVSFFTIPHYVNQLANDIKTTFAGDDAKISAFLEYGLLPVLRSGLLQRIGEFSRFFEAVKDLPPERDLFPILKYGFAPLVEQGVLTNFEDAIDGLHGILDYGDMGMTFWEEYKSLLESSGSYLGRGWNTEEHIPLLLFPFVSQPHQVDSGYFSFSRDGIRSFVAYLRESDPERELFLAQLNEVPGERARNALEARTLLVQHGIHSVPEAASFDEFLEILENQAYRYATRLMNLTPAHLDLLQQEPKSRGERIRNMLASLSLQNVKIRDDGRRVASLLGEMTRAHVTDWRSWRYDAEEGRSQLSLLTETQRELWRSNAFEPIVIEPDRSDERASILYGKLSNIEEQIQMKLTRLDPSFTISPKYEQALQHRILKLVSEGGRTTKKELLQTRRLQLVVNRLLYLRQVPTSYLPTYMVQKAVSSLSQATKELGVRDSTSGFEDYLDAVQAADKGRAELFYLVERDDFAALLDTEDAIRTCIGWSGSSEAVKAILHLASDANVKKLQLARPKRLFSLNDDLPRERLEDEIRVSLGYHTFEIHEIKKRAPFEWWMSVVTEESSQHASWRLRAEEEKYALFLERQNGLQWDGVARFFLQPTYRSSHRYDLYVPSTDVVARQYFRILPTAKGPMIFGDPSQPLVSSYDRVFSTVLGEKAAQMSVGLYEGESVLTRYPVSRNSHIYSPAVFGRGRAPEGHYEHEIYVTY